jgi:3-hydroxyacyl-CoA dehydrogenase/enoyl-CoA hydratase/3-hydroxybutyryl-CoA epimerase
VLVRDSPGFVVNRILMPYLNEAVLLVAEGLPIGQIDQSMKRFGMPMGPLELLDQIGLDVAAHVAQAMQPILAGRFEPNTAFERMRSSGLLGQKSGRGFYVHEGKKAQVHSAAQSLLQGAAGAAPELLSKLSPTVHQREARERMVLLMVNEAALALSEGLTDSAEHLDLAMVMGVGWAPHRGGPLCYADTRSLQNVVNALTERAARQGKRFEPCAELKQRAATRTPFTQSVATAHALPKDG